MFGRRAVNDVVIGAGRNHNGITGPHRLRLHPVKDKRRFASLNAKKLVDVAMNFVTDIFAWCQAH